MPYSNKSFVILISLLVVVFTGCSDSEPEPNNGGLADVSSDTETSDVDADSDVPEDSGADDTVTEDTSSSDSGPVDSGMSDDAGDWGDGDTESSDTAGMEDATNDTDSGDAVSDTEVDTGDTRNEAPGETCDVAIDVTAGGTFDGQTTVGLEDDYDASATADNCPAGSASGADIVYVVTPNSETTYTFTVEPQDASFDPFIYLRDDCAIATCLDGTVLNGPGTRESLEYTVSAGQTVYVIVDGELVTEGPFSLEVDVQ